jgi:His/Glu/Gln/Arg/opine family amino acid ABC transporter permease subunit
MIIDFFKDFFFILGGIKYIFFFGILGFFLGLAIAIFLTFCSLYKYSKYLVKFYISIFRGIPLICQVAAFIYLLPNNLSTNFICLMAIALNTSAYLSEVFRSFIENFPQEKTEVAVGMGFSSYQITRLIIFPEMIGASVPLFIAEIVSIVKDVSILGTFGIMEIFNRGRIIGSINYNYGRSMMMVGIIYYAITFCISRLEDMAWINKFKNHRS